jgi:hypothetical protein
MGKYIAPRVIIIYLNSQQKFSQRTIRIVSVKEKMVFVFDELSGEPRSFNIDCFLAVKKENRYVS